MNTSTSSGASVDEAGSRKAPICFAYACEASGRLLELGPTPAAPRDLPNERRAARCDPPDASGLQPRDGEPAADHHVAHHITAAVNHQAAAIFGASRKSTKVMCESWNANVNGNTVKSTATTSDRK